MDSVLSLLGRNGYLPHGYCFTWSPGLLWSMVIADLSIAAAYFSIPVAMLSYSRRRPDASLNRVIYLFGAFIFACGVTHIMDVWTIWRPDYGVQALTKIATALISVATAIALWPLIPRALKIPSVGQLQAAIASLEAEVGRRRSAEEQLAAIQQSLAVTLASIDAGFIATDRSGRVSHMNAVAETVTGWSERDARGQPLWDVFHREDRPAEYRHQNPVDVAQKLGVTVDSAQRLVVHSRTGTATLLEVKAALMRDDKGEISGLAMVFRDMSGAVRAEADAARLAAIVESSSDAIVSSSLDGRITSWNSGAEALFGFSADEAIGQSVQMLIPDERRDEEMRIMAGVALGAPVPAFDTGRLRRGGEPIDVSITISPIKDSRGRVIGASKIARDMSYRRRAEAALRDSESLLRTINLHFIVSITDSDGRITEVNDSFCATSGYRRDELLGQTHRVVNSGLMPAEFWADLWRTISAGYPWRGQIRNRKKTGALYWVDSVIAPFADKDGRIEKYIAIHTDITVAKRAEGERLETARLEAENRQIREASRLKSQFLANMSHELRTPLNAVIGFADLLHSGYVSPESPKHQEFLGNIATSGRHLLQLINDVLDLSKVESGKFEFFPEPVDLAAVLKEVLDVLYTAVSDKNIQVSTEVDETLVDLTLDASRLKQVLYNYLSNAVKFTPAGGRITVRAMPQGRDHLALEVEDNGVGISAADLSRLFTEFQQLDAGYSKQHPGTGLGLALTRRLVEAQGGSVGVRSTVGVGSTFYAVLNRRHGHDAQRSVAGQGEDGRREAARVLVISDDQRDQAMLVDAFVQAGFGVDAVADGAGAFMRARETAYAALTLDFDLPDGERGLEVLGHIRSQGASHGAPVLGVTIPASDSATAAFAITNVLSKPIRSDEIASAMGRFKGRGEARATVMVIDDEAVARDLMRATLQSLDIEVACFEDGRIALHRIDEVRPDAIVLDLMMPAFDGFQVLDALHRMPVWSEVPVFIWTSMLLTDEEYATLARSARAILLKGGGTMDTVLQHVRRWRQPVLPHDESELT